MRETGGDICGEAGDASGGESAGAGVEVGRFMRRSDTDLSPGTKTCLLFSAGARCCNARPNGMDVTASGGREF